MIGPVVSGSGTGDEQDAAIERIRQFAAGNAIAARAQGRGDEERRWLDVQAIIERIPAAAGVPVPAAPDERDVEWPPHLTSDDKLRDLHARWHDMPGNLYGPEECGWENCEFWICAKFTLDAAATNRAAAVSGQAGPDPEPAGVRERINAIAAIIAHEYDIADPDDEGYRPDPAALATVIHDTLASVAGLSGRAGESSDAATELLRWLVSMDDPDDKAGLEARRTVTLTAIIDRARAALAVEGDRDA